MDDEMNKESLRLMVEFHNKFPDTYRSSKEKVVIQILTNVEILNHY